MAAQRQVVGVCMTFSPLMSATVHFCGWGSSVLSFFSSKGCCVFVDPGSIRPRMGKPKRRFGSSILANLMLRCLSDMPQLDAIARKPFGPQSLPLNASEKTLKSLIVDRTQLDVGL
ncbi:hypothetical protein LIA77_05762 [Sarocladium implicatum]|nr:hypothetical protein LIA77_05762 [Sarocladium implicatum]